MMYTWELHYKTGMVQTEGTIERSLITLVEVID